MFTGICLLVAGALLLTPGFVTDTVGFLLLVPPVRESLGRWLLSSILNSPNTRVWIEGEEIIAPRRGEQPNQPDAIDVDYTEIDADGPGDGDRGRGGST